MKKFFKKHYILSLFLVLLLIFVVYSIFQWLFCDTVITINNHTNIPIAYSNFQYTDKVGEFNFETEEEYRGFKNYYVINRNNSEQISLSKQYWKSSKNVNLSIDFRYQTDYLNSNNIYDLKGISFKDKPKFKEQKSYCSYQIDVYPNRKTVVTPTNKRFCIKPMYYYESN